RRGRPPKWLIEARAETAPTKHEGAAKKKAATPGVGRTSAYAGLFLHRKVEENPYRDGSQMFNAFADIPRKGKPGILFDQWRIKAGEEFSSPRRLHLANMIKKGHAVTKTVA
ncbi:MAG: hypothetical protein O2968_23930, partial [Acidobacteria bacterium]|nr:hypothetical protein [Acidobacteriota bacterium]